MKSEKQRLKRKNKQKHLRHHPKMAGRVPEEPRFLSAPMALGSPMVNPQPVAPPSQVLGILPSPKKASMRAAAHVSAMVGSTATP
jgi:hypothetical protein